MNKLKQTGVRISQYPQGPINNSTHRKRLQLAHSFISWAPAYFGISTINKNYQVPLRAIRDDIKGFIGIDNTKAGYRDYLSFWHGDWFNLDKTKSYIYQWKQEEQAHDDYVYNKHGIDTQYDAEHDIDRIFFLNDAPWPCEATFSPVNIKGSSNYGIDPNYKTAKFVTKKYIDDRHAGVRQIQKAATTELIDKTFGSELQIRPYTCFYQYTNLPAKDTNDGIYTINITDTIDMSLEDNRSLKDIIKHNRLTFYIRLKNRPQYYYVLDQNKNKIHTHNLKLLANGKEVLWSYEDEFIEILRQARPKMDNGAVPTQQNAFKTHIFIKCEAEYVKNESGEDVFTVTCSSFFGRGKNSKRIVQTHFDTAQGIHEINLKLALHENESFLTSIPQQQGSEPEQYYIKLDATGLDDFHEYSWNYYVITPDMSGSLETSNNIYDEVIFESGATPIMWAMEDGYNLAPKLEPNKLYCLQFVKVFDGIIIGRIKYFVNLIKKS